MANKSDENSTSQLSTSPPPTGQAPSGPLPSRGHSGPKDQTDGIGASIFVPPPEMARIKYGGYVSLYHGAWAQIPCEKLEVLVKSNCVLPRPRLIDPAVFFDLLKIRKLAEEACDLSVRATAGIATSALTNPSTVAKSMDGSRVEALGIGSSGPSTGTPLSGERKFRMRDQATQKLSKAYQLDEIASSLVTMRGASILERVAQQVIETPRENMDHLDGKYVHFFHEKISEMRLQEPSSLALIDEVINGRLMSAESLRTRAIAMVQQERYLEAVEELTRALHICRCQQSMHKPDPQKSQGNTSSTADTSDSAKCKELKLDENDYPSSLEPQLLFHTAGAYLELACQAVERALPPKAQNQGSSMGVSNNSGHGDPNAGRYPGASNNSDPGGPSVGENPGAMERDKQGKLITHQNLTQSIWKHLNVEFGKLLLDLSYQKEIPLAAATLHRGPPPGCHSISSLFSSAPPTGLPSNPETDILVDHSSGPQNESGTSALHEAAQQLFDSTNKHESLTYHPFLVEALHGLLLCHVLMQTSTPELQRHAHMAARLIRSCDGYPIFEQPRLVPSCEDWLEVLSRMGEKISLGASWEILCRPRLYSRGGIPSIFPAEGGSMRETEDEKRERVHRKAVLETLRDTSITDNEAFKKALAEKQKEREEEKESKGAAKSDGHKDGASETQGQDKEHNASSIRARSIVRWVREAPFITNTGGRNKRNRTRGRGSARGRSSLNSSMGHMSVTDEKSVETPNKEAD
ncbi:hypothetical protein V491_05035 [Pseudogymnoascus sp. VKM F-3775]|nr:hypothetical protein V491_05035 [Pseudogymnoascus sp. VKM F-3775]